MEPKPVEQYEVKNWRCECGHWLGEVVRTNGIRRLMLYDEQTRIVAVITGLAEITCINCGKTRIWYAPEEGLKEFIDQEIERKLRRIGIVAEIQTW